jgi:hypothetical protein
VPSSAPIVAAKSLLATSLVKVLQALEKQLEEYRKRHAQHLWADCSRKKCPACHQSQNHQNRSLEHPNLRTIAR